MYTIIWPKHFKINAICLIFFVQHNDIYNKYKINHYNIMHTIKEYRYKISYLEFLVHESHL